MSLEKKEQLTKLLDFIFEISQEKGNEWFKEELKNRVFRDINPYSNKNLLLDLKKDTFKILDFLNISPELTIDYSFINYTLLRKRLEFDNLRMENARYDLAEKDEMLRLYNYIINAFYQIENLINFYYHEKYKTIDRILAHLESIEGTKFKRKDEKSLGDITISAKIFAFNATFYKFKSKEDYTGYNIDSLRLIRNESSHRITRIKSIENENKRLHDFLKHATFDSVLALVRGVADKVKENV